MGDVKRGKLSSNYPDLLAASLKFFAFLLMKLLVELDCDLKYFFLRQSIIIRPDPDQIAIDSRRRLLCIRSGSGTSKTGAKFIVSLPGSDADSYSVEPALSSKTVRPCAPCGAWCMDHVIKAWSAVCSGVPHSQFGD